MMTRILSIVLIILAVAAGILYLRNKSLRTELSAAKGEITALNKQIKGYENEIQHFNEAQATASEKIEKVRTIVKTVKTDCDCYNEPLPDELKRLLSGKK